MSNQSEFTRRTFIKLTSAGVAAAAIDSRSFGETSTVYHPELASVGQKFQFAILADPHIGPEGIKGEVADNGQATLRQAVAEINGMKSAFVVHIGDICNVADPPSIAHWEQCTAPVQPTQVFVHGNHDGRVPYEVFLAVQEKRNGIKVPFYSFNCGAWHFTVIPCNLFGANDSEVEMERRMFEFLEQDIEQFKDRPTICLQHLHSLPVGMGQTEWYFYDLDTRKRLMEIYTRYGNVKWVFNGHIHNGFLASEKTSWSYHGINFINLPTITVERPYGEEYPAYSSGLNTGGYYTVVDVDGDRVSLLGRLAGKSEPHLYPATYQMFSDQIEPRLFHTIGELPAQAALTNGGFAGGLAHWNLPWRYMRAEKPVYEARVLTDESAPNGRVLALATRPNGILSWARDDYYEAYQISTINAQENPQISLAYKQNRTPQDGGGYARLEFLRDQNFVFLMMFYWGNNEADSSFYPNAVQYELTGKHATSICFEQMAKRKQGFFWKLLVVEGKWHTLKTDVGDLYDRALDQSGAFTQSGVNKVRIAVGTWSYCSSTESEALFSGIKLKHSNTAGMSMLDDQALTVGPGIFDVDFGTAIWKQNRDRGGERGRGAV